MFSFLCPINFCAVPFVNGSNSESLQEKLCFPWSFLVLQLFTDTYCVMLVLVYGWQSLSKFLAQ